MPEQTGIVVSDLHLFAGRSRAPHLMARIHAASESASVIVLNGDTFDFNWTTLTTLAATVDAAEQWLEDFSRRHSRARICFIVGNHDSYEPFMARLAALCERLPNLEWHMLSLRIGRCLFLHGDCVSSAGTGKADDVIAYRRTWAAGARRGPLAGAIVYIFLLAKIIPLMHLAVFPRRRVIRRLARWIERHHPDMPAGGDVFFGHTHRAFSGYEHIGRRYHNTGSAIIGMPFNMMAFALDDAAPH